MRVDVTLPDGLLAALRKAPREIAIALVVACGCGPGAAEPGGSGTESGSSTTQDVAAGCQLAPDCPAFTAEAGEIEVCWVSLPGAFFTQMALQGDHLVVAGSWKSADEEESSYVFEVTLEGELVPVLHNNFEVPDAIAADQDGGFVVSGSSNLGIGTPWLRRRGGSGDDWSAQPEDLRLPFGAIVVAPDGRTWAAGTGWGPDGSTLDDLPMYVARFDRSGQLEMDAEYERAGTEGVTTARAITWGVDETVHVLGTAADGTRELARLDEDGLVGVSAIDIDPEGLANPYELVRSGDTLFVGGTLGEHAIVAALTLDGEAIWVRTVDADVPEASGRIKGIAALPDGDLIVVGSRVLGPDTDTRGWIARITADGDIVGSVFVDGRSDDGLAIVEHVVALPDGELMLAGRRTCEGDRFGPRTWLARVRI